MTLITKPYLEQLSVWPRTGHHIMAQFDTDSILVYQAYRPSIARYAIENQRFGGDFSFSRMSWIKPNFLWMMYRSGWAAKEGQEYILAVRLRRTFFDEILEKAVASTFSASDCPTHEVWQTSLQSSEVRLQWDPDHDPLGNSVERRAVQLGLRGEMLRRYGTEALLGIEDITPFVREQRTHAADGFAQLVTPVEHIYQPSTEAAALAVGIDR
ncbi:MAG: DUF4291 domain-containing protein [Prosthecobacter sp.]|uniref:DUF4291 domain-containing protein n=1 Tax=Prosthecobacter sp. TaxID=1965333 RepID=UPI0038FF6E30